MIPLDKQAHALAGYGIALTLATFRLPLEGLVLAIVAGALKEWWDYRHPLTHTADVLDFAATAGGGFLAFGVSLVREWIMR